MVTAAPRFDILVPHYGDTVLLQAAVRSVLALDTGGWRLTVVDDGAEPGVGEWFAGLGDARVRYFRNPRNLGVSGNFNRCLQLADAEYVVLMGCDDLMHPGYLRVVEQALRAVPGAAMVQPGVRVIGSDGRPAASLADAVKRRIHAPLRSGHRPLGGEELAVSLLRGNWLYFPSICWRTDALSGRAFRADLAVIQDLALVLELVAAGERLAVADEVCFSYRRHALSESSAQALSGARFVEARRFFLETAGHMDRLGWHRAALTARRHLWSRLHALSMVPGALRRGRPDGAAGLIRFALGAERR
ncbi:glycosyltransferase family 2 protein [Streptacidiphilus sp. N1-12]|uniref:Glycosyltransferase family 2 protein n=2 Tax=Streptacidiphilus alkalitolerans TaxID=3342712 RepID=A0ABV6V5Y5_9ACTN